MSLEHDPHQSQTSTSIWHLDLTLQQTALLEALELLHQLGPESMSEQHRTLHYQVILRIRYSVLNSLPPSLLEEAHLRLLRSHYPNLFRSIWLSRNQSLV